MNYLLVFALCLLRKPGNEVRNFCHTGCRVYSNSSNISIYEDDLCYDGHLSSDTPCCILHVYNESTNTLVLLQAFSKDVAFDKDEVDIKSLSEKRIGQNTVQYCKWKKQPPNAIWAQAIIQSDNCKTKWTYNLKKDWISRFETIITSLTFSEEPE